MDLALLVFAYAAGAAAFFAPCCVAMLPAYVSYAIRPPAGAVAQPGPPHRFARHGLSAVAFGFFPFIGGAIPLAVEVMASVGLVPAPWTDNLPSLEASVALISVGALMMVAGLVLAGRGKAAARGALFGLLATAGFFTVFLILGLPIVFVARSLIPFIPWFAAGVGGV